jgi:hypothetical protein
MFYIHFTLPIRVEKSAMQSGAYLRFFPILTCFIFMMEVNEDVTPLTVVAACQKILIIG